MPWQRAMYNLVEDCDQALDPEAADLFDREANVFASEVLFQNDTFSDMVADETFEIWTPIPTGQDVRRVVVRVHTPVRVQE